MHSKGPLKALKEHRFDVQTELEVGSLIILLVNLNPAAGLLNGSKGRAVRSEKLSPNAHVSSKNLCDIAAFKQSQIRRFTSTNTVKEYPVVLLNNGFQPLILPLCASPSWEARDLS